MNPNDVQVVGFDTETHLIQPGLLAPPIVCGSFANDRTSWLLTPEVTATHLRRKLTDGYTIAGANIAYDFGVMLAYDPSLWGLIWSAYEGGRVFDVEIAALLNAIAEGRLREGELFFRDGTKARDTRYSLSACVEEWLGRKDAKDNDLYRLSYALLEGIPIEEWPEVARKYPIDDAVNTREVAVAQMKGAQNLHNQSAQAHAAFCMHLGSIWGLRTDGVAVQELKAKLLTARAGHIERLTKEGLYRVKGMKKAPKLTKDLKALRERVEAAYGGHAPKTAKGGISADKLTLEETDDPILNEMAELSNLDKLLTYLPDLEAASRTPLNVGNSPLLATGRSSYRGVIQLLPRKGGARECIIPSSPTRVFCSVDYAAIELSALAQVCIWAVGESELGKAINSGIDPHSKFAASLVGMGYEEFLKRKKEPELADKRQAAKAANFGFPGMMGAPAFVSAKRREGLKICELIHRDGRCGHEKGAYTVKGIEVRLCARCVDESKSIREAWFRQWPEVKAYWRWLESAGCIDGAVTQFISKRIRGGLRAPQAANTLFQGLVADGAKKAVVELTRQMYTPGYALTGSRLLVFAHDETIVEMEESTAYLAAHNQAATMVECMQQYIPDVAVSAEPCLMRRWYKAAEPRFDAKGRLIPWEP